ncbi:MAG TPA: ATP-binding protein [Pseudobacteroides sp.]|uniref:HAMP domain-containing sensor histidine kinase n=1 Tax=Pseudobacteroides sp. TaxID=1968840 RepID=UPI002F93C7FF
MKTIFSKLLTNFILTIVICLAIAGISLSFVIRNYISEQKENELVLKAQVIAQSTKHFFVKNENPHDYINTINHLDSNLGTEVWAVDENGIVIAAAAEHLNCEGSKLSSAELKEMQSGRLTVSNGYSEYFKDPVIRVTTPIIDKNKVIGAVIVYSPVKGIDEATRRLVFMMIFAAIISLSIALIFCIYTSKKIAKPVQKMAEASMEVADGNKFTHVPISTEFKEFNQLAGSFNHMLERIEQNEKRMKDFVGNVSHELKSPLTSIKGFIEALIDGKGKTAERTQKFLSIMDKEANRLIKLIDDLLILCKADSIVKVEPQKINIIKLIQEVITNFEVNAHQKLVSFKLDCASKLLYAKVEPHSLKQIMINLLDNAIKYSPENSQILVTVSPNSNEVEISITDRGPGIPEEDIPNIWDRFYRVDKARSRETGGTGLGLAIVKELIDKNGGEISVKSNIGKGTTFKFKLPIAV